MEKLTEILKNLERGKISSDHAKSEILRLFNINSSPCPKCNSEKINDLGYNYYSCSKCEHEWHSNN